MAKINEIGERRNNLSAAKQALLAKRLRGEFKGSEKISRISPRSSQEQLPLSFAQQRLWFLEQMGGSTAYNMPAVLALSGMLNIEALQQTLSAVVARHESLRTTFAIVDGQPQQVIQAAAAFDLPVIELSHLPAAVQATEVQRLITVEAQRPFDLTQDWMLRATLLRLREATPVVNGASSAVNGTHNASPPQYILLLTMHHIASDGWSIGVLVRELAALYEAFAQGHPAPLPALPIQYADFAVWQRAQLQGEVLADHLRYWTSQLADAPQLLELPTDHPRPAVNSYRGRHVSFQVDATLTTALKHLSQQHGATLFMTLLAAFQTLLYRYTGQATIVVGSPIANRTRPELEPLIGFFVNTLALRADLGDQPNFLTLLAQVRQRTQAAYEHQDLPFERLVEELHLDRNLSYNPLVQVMFALQNAPMGNFALPGLQVSLREMEVQSTRVDVEMHLLERAGALDGYCVYSADLFEQATIERLIGHFRTLLAAIVAYPEQSVAALPLLTDMERQQILVEWNDTATAYPQEQCIHQLFEAQVARTPDAVAVVFDSGEQQRVGAGAIQNGRPQSPNHPIIASLTYRELNARANQLAHYLRSVGVGSTLGAETLVGLCVERSLDMVVGLLAILKAGGAYIPIDPTYPIERIRYMLADSAAPILLTQSCLAPALQAEDADAQYHTMQPIHVLAVDTLMRQFAEQSIQNLQTQTVSNDLAYVIYTSGSTGQPKGVTLTHRGLCNATIAHIDTYNIQPTSRILQAVSFSFDVATANIFMALCAGATLLLPPPQALLVGDTLFQQLQDFSITHLQVPVSILASLPHEELPALHTIIVGGEAVPMSLVKQWSIGRRFFNAYGPTEATICATVMSCHEGISKYTSPPIGVPLNNVQVFILDRNLQLTPINVVGELHIGGIQLARGYLNRPTLTAERFIDHPAFGRIYKTGDWARWLPDGNIEFLGRIDQQVKLRGFRIELGEIEALLTTYSAVQEAVVVAREDTPGEKQLVAYVTSNMLINNRDAKMISGEDNTLLSGHSLTQSALRDYLRSQLPDYMVPSAFVLLDALPLTPNGKVDRKALPAPTGQLQVETKYVMPQGALEQTLAAIWQEELKVERVGIYDNFFDLGGHSLLLVRVHSRLKQVVEQEIKIIDLFTYPTIHALSQYLQPSVQGITPPTMQLVPQGHATVPIAVIGMAGRFPGAASVTEFWQRLCAGEELVTHFSTAELTAAGVPRHLQEDPRYVPASGILRDFDRFDATFFGISPREAALLPPQQRLFLECVWTALEDANCDPQNFPGAIGLYAGASMDNYHTQAFADLAASEEMSSAFQTVLNSGPEFLTTRTAYRLNLRGPALVINTACSTSLVAVHMACQALRNGECDVALAGGASVNLFEKRGYLYQEGMIMSPDGHCRAFDAQAQGTVGGNGVGVVVLKRLDAALADGDVIHAVIKGTAINNDGADKVGYTAPSVRGQAAVIAQAQANAGITPDTISYIETHGTGTKLGDPIEIAALKQVFGQKQAGQPACALGAVKTNVGHLDTAAGVTGLIKAVLALKHKQIPPTLHFTTPNPELGLEHSPFYVNRALLAWEEGPLPRRAGVSSFGIGGTNAHVVLEEAPEPAAPMTAGLEDNAIEASAHSVTLSPCHLVTTAPSHHLLPLSAKSEAALTALVARYVDFLAAEPAADLADICYTAQIGRAHFAHRLGFVAASQADLLTKLTAWQTAQTKVGATPGQSVTMPPQRKPKVAFLFTGQGAQYVGMGRELYATEPTFRTALDHCNVLLQQYLEVPLLALLFGESEAERSTPHSAGLPAVGENSSGQSAHGQLDDTTYTQPALFALEYALAKLWQSWGIEPDVVIGHSIGEVVAACVAGVFSLEDGIKLIAARGRLMGTLPANGAMVAVLASEAYVRAALSPYGNEVAIAAVNGPQNIVIAGAQTVVQAVVTALHGDGIRTRPLKVSHAFHSPLMAPILDALRQVATTIHYQQPQVPLISTVTGQLATPAIATADYWVRHAREAVRFVDGMVALQKEGVDVLLEIGPKPTLVGMARQILDQMNSSEPLPLSTTQTAGGRQTEVVMLPSLRQGYHAVAQMLESVGELYRQGATVTWRGLPQGETRRKVTLPTYPFQRQRYWQEAPASRPKSASNPLDLQTLIADADIDQLTQLLAATGKLPKVIERLVAGYDATAVPAGNGVASVDKVVTEPAHHHTNGTNGHVVIMPQGAVAAVEMDPQSIRQQLAAADTATRPARLLAWLQSTTAQLLGYQEEQVTPELGPGLLGMDSLLVLELRSRIEAAIAVTIPAPLLLTASFTQLAAFINEQWPSDADTAVPTTELQLSAVAAPPHSPRATRHAWVRSYAPRPAAQLRLFTLPFAGGGASLYRPWATRLPETIELCALQLPGREDRLAEPPPATYAALVDALVDALIPYLDKPLALYGHSMGGQLAYAVAQALRTAQGVEPHHLLIGAAAAPQWEKVQPYASRWELFAALEGQGGGATTVQTDPELAALARRIFDADMTLSKGYQYQAGLPLTCPVTVFGGLADPICSLEALRGWQAETTGPFALHMLPGNHFFLQQETTKVLAKLSELLL